MKIAVASDDGVSIAGHFGRCACFVVYEIADQKATRVELRANSAGRHHGQGDCTDHQSGERVGHDHESFLMALHDCEAVICRGMGRRAIADLTVRGVKPLMVSDEISADEAVERYSQGRLQLSHGSKCCSH